METRAGSVVGVFLCLLASPVYGQTPANDLFASPQVIAGLSGNISGSNVNATLEAGEPTITATFPGERSVWFQWVVPANGSFTFGIAAGFDTQLAIYAGSAVSSLVSQGESDLGGNGGDSVTLSAMAGTTYMIRVTGYLSQSGSFILNWVWNVDPVYEKIFSFTDAAAERNHSGSHPSGGLAQGFDGNYYGTTQSGGVLSKGSIFRMTPDGETTILVQFNGINGGAPYGLTLGDDGNFYGTTHYGGANDDGTVFKVTPDGVFTTLFEFDGQNGDYPTGPLLLASDEFFYGTTRFGGAYGRGAIFRISTSGTFSVVAALGPGDGRYPSGGLAQGDDGNFYGATSYGDNLLNGTIYRVTPGGTLTTLLEFDGGNGRYPRELIKGNDGNLYGTTNAGGSADQGTVFKVTLAGVHTKLADFDGANGRSPDHKLVLAGDGVIYGTTSYGGAGGNGTVFRITSAGDLTTLVAFDPASGIKGANPSSGLMRGSDGFYYGTTFGGVSGSGTIFKMSASGVLSTLVDFPGFSGASGRRPGAGLVPGDDGNFYGSATDGSGAGTIFRISPAGVVSNLVKFTGTSGGSKGSEPESDLVDGKDGYFYGTTPFGGDADSASSGAGTIFRLSPNGSFTTLVEFTGAGGSFMGRIPNGLTRHSNGNFYGRTHSIEGSGPAATVFRLTPAGEFTSLFEFTGYTGLSGDFIIPSAGLLEGSDGLLYGVTDSGGLGNLGTVFKMTPSGQMTKLVDFTGNSGANKGSNPQGRLALGNDGSYYGTTAQGGGNGKGTVFKVTSDGVLTTLVEFSGNGDSNKGSHPSEGVVVGPDGNFYGITEFGGANGRGTIFKMTSGGVLTTLYDFADDAADAQPSAALVVGPDGNLYGTTFGTNGFGCVFRLVFPGKPNLYELPATGVKTTGASIQCKLNPRGSSTSVTFQYGTDQNAFPPPMTIHAGIKGFKSIQLGRVLSGLNRGTTYYYRFRAVNGDGITESPVQSFSTLAEPVATVSPASEVGPASALLNGSVNSRNFESEVRFEWGTDGNSFPNTLPASPDTVIGNTDNPVSAPLAGLVKDTTYYYRIVATNAGGTTVSGTQSFTTLTEPSAITGGSFALGTTSVRVEGTANARGSITTVEFQYGTDGVSFDSVAASPGSISGSSDTGVAAVLNNLAQGVTYHYRVRVSSLGGSATSETATFTMAVLSGFAQAFPGAAPPSDGFLFVTLSPSDIGGGWRFLGEQQWRASAVPAGGLTSGDREIEFRPVAGYIQPPRETVTVNSGEAATFVQREYFLAAGIGSGGLNVVLKPESITTDEGRARWRLLGEDDTKWRDSGENLANLAAGTYLVECSDVAGRSTPPPAQVRIGAGETPALTLTYFLNEETVGSLPVELTFTAVSGNESMPYGHVGQIRSLVGAGTGFVVKPRVVATAAHVVWDDGTLAAAPGVRWLFQQHRGVHEPRPVIPRGFHMLTGYAAARSAPGVQPGEGTSQSQNLDVAALYFADVAGRGGFSGYLASDLPDNEFLLSDSPKLLAGYPLNGIGAAGRDRMHATLPANLAFEQANGRVFRTTGIRSFGGNSGGPLCVFFEGSGGPGAYYPAAIYLGGGPQTLVRVIDGDVAALFNEAEQSSSQDDNGTGDGVSHIVYSAEGNQEDPGALKVIIEPPDAVEKGAKWRFAGEAGQRASSSQRNNLSAGNYLIEFLDAEDFINPGTRAVTVSGGAVTTFTLNYEAVADPLQQWRVGHFGTEPDPELSADDADPDGDGVRNLDEYIAGTNPLDPNDRFAILTAAMGSAGYTVSSAGKEGRTYVLQRRASLAVGTWTEVTRVGPLTSDGAVSLTDPSPLADQGFYRLEVSFP